MSTVHFLGFGAGYYPAFGPTAAWFREGTRLYMMDCGTSAFERLVRAGALDGCTGVTVFLSHVHADHVGSLGILLDYCYDMLGIVPLLVHPDAGVNELLRRMGVTPEAYRYAPQMQQADENGVVAEFFPVLHAPDISCFGYILRTADDCFCYTGDANAFPAQALEGLNAGRIDRVYQDTASHPSAHHCFLGRLQEAVPPELRGRVFCVHLDCDCREQIRAAGFRLPE